MTPETSPPAASRECGGCTLCCKVMSIGELGKASGSWCAHCKPGRGCGVYAARPTVCRSFMCVWLNEPGLGPEWRPDRSKMVLLHEAAGRRLVIKCDPGFPRAWRSAPYHAEIQRWASQAGPNGGEVIVCVGHDMTVLANGREVHLGRVEEDDGFTTEYDLSGRLLRCRIDRRGASAPVLRHSVAAR